jgi:hypothetical protein
MGVVLGFLKKKSISVVVVSVIALTLGSLIALASGYLPLSNYASASGNYVSVWAYVRGDADLDEYGCLTGWIFNVWGTGGGSIDSPASGSIDVNPPTSDVAYYEAKTETIGNACTPDGKCETVKAVARIVAPLGAC